MSFSIIIQLVTSALSGLTEQTRMEEDRRKKQNNLAKIERIKQTVLKKEKSGVLKARQGHGYMQHQQTVYTGTKEEQSRAAGVAEATPIPNNATLIKLLKSGCVYKGSEVCHHVVGVEHNNAGKEKVRKIKSKEHYCNFQQSTVFPYPLLLI